MAAVAVLAVGTVLLAAAPAPATPIGTLTFDPHTGKDDTPITLNSSTTCPGTATNLIVTLNGTGFTNAVAVGNSPLSAYQQANGGYLVPLAGTMRDLANQQSPPAPLSPGRYDFTLTCRKAFGDTSLGDFTGSIWFTSTTAYQDTNPNQTSTATPTTTTPTPTDTGTDTSTSTPTDTFTELPTETPTGTGSTLLPVAGTSTSAGGSGTEGVATTIGGGRLAGTGVSVWPQLLLAEVLLLVGAILTLATRRRRPAGAGRHR